MENKYTQMEFSKGLFELNEETLKELSDSKYMNADIWFPHPHRNEHGTPIILECFGLVWSFASLDSHTQLL